MNPQDTNLLEPRFVQGKEMLLAGLGATVPYEKKETTIMQLWNKFGPQMDDIQGKVGDAGFGLCYHFKGGQSFDYLAAVEVKSDKGLPKDFKTQKLPAQNYAVFAHKGHVSELPKTLDAIHSKWLPNSGYKSTETGFFERYSEEFNPATGTGGMEVWLPVKK